MNLNILNVSAAQMSFNLCWHLELVVLRIYFGISSFNFCRFKEGLKTLGVLDAMRTYPESFRPLLCHQPPPLTANSMDQLFKIRLSVAGSNKRMAEERVVPFWRDYLLDVEGKYWCCIWLCPMTIQCDIFCTLTLFIFFCFFPHVLEEAGALQLSDVLAFATGASIVPPIGFSPQPTIDFLHDQSGIPGRCLPMANTCINCLKLPLCDTYNEFKDSMDYALQNTQGFGRE